MVKFNVIDNGDELIGSPRELIGYTEQNMKDMLIEGNDDYIYAYKDMAELLIALYEIDAELVKVSECSMGGFSIIELEEK